MVNVYKQENKNSALKAIEIECSALDILGRGVGKCDGLVYFVEGLMPKEKARVQVIQALNSAKHNGDDINGGSSKDKVRIAKITKMITSSSERRAKMCDLSDKCGGCPLEHLPCHMALEAKMEGVSKLLTKSVVQGTMLLHSTKSHNIKGSAKLGRNSTIKQVLAQKQAQQKNLKKQKEIEALSLEASLAIKKPSFVITSDELNYRRACRLAIRVDHGKLHLGFRESKNQNLVPLKECMVLTPRLNHILNPLKQLINRLSNKKALGHIELLDSDASVGVLLRLTQVLNAQDEDLLKAFSQEHELVVSVIEPYKQIDDKQILKERVIASGYKALASTDELDLSLVNDLIDANFTQDLYIKAQNCKLYCSPSSFVQVNAFMNNNMLEKVLATVNPHQGQKVLDLFSGLGNFALPIAKAQAQVVGVDIVSNMVKLANINARLNGIDKECARFFVADLEAPFENQLWAQEQYDVVVLDPGRMGAKRAVEYLTKLKPQKIVMISCNPLAAARDSIHLLAHNYTLSSWGGFDMFPRTSHVEIMLTFTLNTK